MIVSVVISTTEFPADSAIPATVRDEPSAVVKAVLLEPLEVVIEMMGLIGMGNNPMVGATVACAVAVIEGQNNK